MNAQSDLPGLISAVQKYMLPSITQTYNKCDHLQAAEMHVLYPHVANETIF